MAEEQQIAGRGFGVASLVTGILSLITIQFIIISTALAIMAIIFGIVSLKQGKNGIAKAGLAIGLVTIGITIALYLFIEVLDISLFTIPEWYR